ncbi:MAG: FAD-dependent oxidoreductase [Defluviicoccus sp.]|nr:FAD-dependent oxidoreductase [Defluviicoccus sp.]
MGQIEAVDLLCVGSGLAGLSAALAAAGRGLKSCVVEKSTRLGGGSAMSSGGVWIGANRHQAAHGLSDSPEETRAYLDFIAGGASVPENLAALAERSDEALGAFEGLGVSLLLRPKVPDQFYPRAPGSTAAGRSFNAAPIARAELGEWSDLLQDNPYFPPGMSSTDMVAWGGLGSMQDWDPKLLRERAESGRLGTGQAIVGQFLAGLGRAGVPILTEFEAGSLIRDNGRVTGIRGRHAGRPAEIAARRGVVLATGGYESNPDLVARFEGVPGWRSMFPASITGDGMTMATEIGAAIHRVPENFFFFLGYDIPGAGPGGAARFRMTGFTELSYPHSMVVNRAGRRFFDESSFQKGVRAIKAFDQANRDFPNLPCFMIFDRRFQERYSFAERPPGAPPPGWLARADSLAGLAAELGIDGSALEETAASFNRGAAEGRDPEFGRGDFLWIQVLSGDSAHPIHPNLAPVSEPPFYGVRLHPSGSSSAGLLTDADARVLHVRGHPIAGLYACGSAAAQTDFGVGYQGGLLLVRGMTFGYLAARHAASAPGD